MVEKIGNLITSYCKQKKMPAALLDRLSWRPPLIDKKHIGKMNLREVWTIFRSIRTELF